MMKNASMLLATYTVLNPVLQFPFAYEDLKGYLVECLQKQQAKRAGNGKAANWWTLFLYNVKNRKLNHGINFDIKGPTLSLVWMECYGEDMVAAKQLHGIIGTGRDEMMDALKTANEWMGTKESYRYANKIGDRPSRVSRVVQFDINKLSEQGFDIIGMVQATHLTVSNYAGADIEQTTEQLDMRKRATQEEANEYATTAAPGSRQMNIDDEDPF
jgi:hypothetical protein